MRAARLRISGFFWRHRWAKGLLLLAPPLLAFGLIYLASLVALFVSAFWTVNPFTTDIEHIWNLGNFRTIFESSAYRTIALRTIGIAAAVTLTDAVLAFPLAYFMARVASAALAGVPLRRRPAAALVELPDPRLHLAADPRTRTARSTGR